MPYWRLSGFYFFYFAALGALIPFWGLYLQTLGFDAVAIGELIAEQLDVNPSLSRRHRQRSDQKVVSVERKIWQTIHG